METSTELPQSPEIKKCNRCHGDFWLSEFEPRSRAGYLKSYCRECRKQDLKRIKKYNPSRQEYNAYQRDYQRKLREKGGNRLLSDL